MTHLLKSLLATLLFLALPAAAGQQPTDDPQTSPVWLKVKASLFENKPIAAAPAEMLLLEAPARAIDAAVVPIAIRAKLAAERSAACAQALPDHRCQPVAGLRHLRLHAGQRPCRRRDARACR